MKKIVLFSLQYHPFVGGAEVAIKEITDRIPRTDIEFHMVTARFDSRLPRIEQVGNVLVHRIGLSRQNPSIADLGRFPLHVNKYWFQVAAFLTALSLHKKYRYDAIWAMMAHSSGIPAGLFKIVHPEVPYLLTLQEGDPTEHIEKIMRPVWSLFRQGFVKADSLQAISTFLLAWGKRMGFAGSGVVIPNGYDSTVWFSAVSNSAQNRNVFWKNQHQLNFNNDDTLLITTSRLVHKNAIDDVIRALPLLKADVHFVIFGKGEKEDELRRLAEELGVSNRTHFLGEIKNTAVAYALHASDIFIRPSRSEGMGNSFIEAMAAGLPVIATQEGGIADFLFDATRNPDKETTGWAVDKDSPEQIASAVQDILRTPERTQEVTHTAQAMVESSYDWNSIASRMRDLLTGLTTSS